MERLCADLTNHFRNLMVVKTVKKAEDILVCTQQELVQYKAQSEKFTLESVLYCISLLQESMANIKRGANRRIEMEMTAIKMSTPSLSSDNEALLHRIATLERMIKQGAVTTSVPAADTVPQVHSSQDTAAADSTPASSLQTAKADTAESDIETHGEDTDEIDWAEVLSELAKTNPPLKGILEGSQAIIRGDYVLIKSSNPTLGAFIKQQGYSRDVKDAIYHVTGRRYRLGLLNSESATSAPQTPKRDPLENLIGRARQEGVPVDVTE